MSTNLFRCDRCDSGDIEKGTECIAISDKTLETRMTRDCTEGPGYINVFASVAADL